MHRCSHKHNLTHSCLRVCVVVLRTQATQKQVLSAGRTERAPCMLGGSVGPMQLSKHAVMLDRQEAGSIQIKLW